MKKKKRKLPPPKKKRRNAPRAKRPAPREVGLIDALGEAYGDIEELATEMREWADNMEDKFSHTQKYETVSETADTLESITDPTDDSHPFLNDTKVTVQDMTPRKRGYSRADRCGQATYIINLVAEALESYETENADHETAANGLKDDLENHESELQGCEFPGMYG